MRALPIVAALLLALATTRSPASAGDVRASGKLISGATTGPPLEVVSSDRVADLNADRLDGFDATDFAGALHDHAGVPYANVLVVSPSGGDFTSIQAAIDSVADASAANPYLIWIGPGVYEEQVTTKAGIDLRGAGRELTVIRGAAGASSVALLRLVGNGEVRSLTVDNRLTGPDGAPTTARAVHVSGDSPRLVDVAVRSSAVCSDPDTNFSAEGMLAISGAAPSLVRVRIEAEVTGTQASGFCNAEAFSAVAGAMPVFDDGTLVGRGTTLASGNSIAIALSTGTGSLAIVRDSVLMATGADFANRALHVVGGTNPSSARVAHSQVIGSTLGSDIVCVGAYDSDFVALGTGCT